jgi:hypothetical protein
MIPLRRALTVRIAVLLSLSIAMWLVMGPPMIRVENHSAREIRSLEVAGNGFNERISRLGPGESVCVRPSGIPAESGLEFRAALRRRMNRGDRPRISKQVAVIT